MNKEEKELLTKIKDSDYGLFDELNNPSNQEEKTFHKLISLGYIEEVSRKVFSGRVERDITRYRISKKGHSVFFSWYRRTWFYISNDIRAIIVSSITAIVIIVVSVFVGQSEHTQTVSPSETQFKKQEIITNKIKQDDFVEAQLPQTEEKNTEKEIETYYPVIKVVDGDTLSIDMDGQKQTLRLIGIDTPETVHPSKPVECFGREASAKAKEILTGQSIRIEEDTTQGELDKYGRLLVYVFLKDGTNFNKMMIEQGFGYEYTYDLPYKYQQEFKLAEQTAREQKIGLWADGVCEEPQEDTASTLEDIFNPQITETPVKSNCSSNVYNCGDFTTHKEAQATYDYCGGVNNDIHRLDNDKDGEACESLP